MEINKGCELIRSTINNNLYVCKHCNKVYHYENIGNNICPILLDKYAMDPNFPQIRLTKIETRNDGDSESNTWWENKNNTVIDNISKDQCSQEQIDNRMKICEGCEFFRNNTCMQRGCSLNRERNYKNKLFSAKQSCPIGKWGPES